MIQDFTAAVLLVGILRLYAILGLATSVLFLLIGLDRCAPNARGAYAFRPLLLPGLVLLWPYVLWRWWRIETGQPEP